MLLLPTIITTLLLSASAVALPQGSASSPISREGLRFAPRDWLTRPRTLPKPLRQLHFDQSCNEERQQEVLQSFKDALEVVNDLFRLKSPAYIRKDSVQYRTFMNAEGNNFDEIYKRFKDMRDLLTTNSRPLKISCNLMGDGCGLGKMAGTNRENRQINYCLGFFTPKLGFSVLELGAKIPDFQEFNTKLCKAKEGARYPRYVDFDMLGFKQNEIDVLKYMPVFSTIRALSHLFTVPGNFGITDCYYGPYAAEYLALRLPDAARSNADNYPWYAITEYLNNLCDSPNQGILRATKDKGSMLTDASFEKQYETFEEQKEPKIALDKINDALRRNQADYDRIYEQGTTLRKQDRPSSLMKVKEVLLEEKAVAEKNLKDVKITFSNNGFKICDTGKRWDEIEDIMLLSRFRIGG